MRKPETFESSCALVMIKAELQKELDTKIDSKPDEIRGWIRAVTETFSAKVGEKIASPDQRLVKLQGLVDDLRSEPPSEPGQPRAKPEEREFQVLFCCFACACFADGCQQAHNTVARDTTVGHFDSSGFHLL